MKDCPFCGGAPKLRKDGRLKRDYSKPVGAKIKWDWFYVQCCLCGAKSHAIPNQKEAIGLWDKRK